MPLQFSALRKELIKLLFHLILHQSLFISINFLDFLHNVIMWAVAVNSFKHEGL